MKYSYSLTTNVFADLQRLVGVPLSLCPHISALLSGSDKADPRIVQNVRFTVDIKIFIDSPLPGRSEQLVSIGGWSKLRKRFAKHHPII